MPAGPNPTAASATWVIVLVVVLLVVIAGLLYVLR